MTEVERIKMFTNTMIDDGIELPITVIPDLIELGFFSAPASVGHHGNYEGGLFDHSMSVYNNLYNLTFSMDSRWGNNNSIFIVALFHDLCKTKDYEKTENGFQYVSPRLVGHAERSIEMIKNILYVDLTEEEELCIRWHMGAFDRKENWNKYGEAIEKYPNVLYTHTADMIASKIDKI